jgi:hypothetical protein
LYGGPTKSSQSSSKQAHLHDFSVLLPHASYRRAIIF